MRISKERMKEIAEALKALRFFGLRKPKEDNVVVHVDFVRKTVESDKRSANE